MSDALRAGPISPVMLGAFGGSFVRTGLHEQELQPQPTPDPVRDEDGSGGSSDDEGGPTRCICELHGRVTGQIDRRRLTDHVWLPQTTTKAGSW